MANTNTQGKLSPFRRVLKRISSFGQDGERVVPTEPEPDLQHEARKKLLQEIEDTSLNFPDDDHELIPTVNRHIFSFTALYHLFGVQDGKLVAKNHEIATLTTNHATRIVEQVVSKLHSTQASLTDQLSTKNEIKRSRLERHLRWTDFSNQMTQFYQSSHRNFSKGIAITCLAFGFLLMIADLPLSLALVGHFGVGVDSDDFVTQLLDPGLLLFALGIAFCTVYIKILYDEYINTDLEEWRRKFLLLSKPDLNSDSQVAEAFQGRRFYIKLTVRLLILAALITTLVFLGIFRNMYSELSEVITDDNGVPYFSGEWALFVRLVCFVGITLVIPTISGVCLSLGFSIFHCRAIRQDALKKIKQVEQELKSVDQEISDIKRVDARLSSFLLEWTPTRIITISSEFVNYYLQGYKRGYVSSHGNDQLKQIRQLYNDQVINILTHY